jgi:hypothetical protein
MVQILDGIMCRLRKFLCFLFVIVSLSEVYGQKVLISPHSLQLSDVKHQAPRGFEISGDAFYSALGDSRIESSGKGIRLLSGYDLNKDEVLQGKVSVRLTVPKKKTWYRLKITGLANEYFSVKNDDLYLKAEFFKDNGAESLDFVMKRIYGQVQLFRKDMLDKETNPNLGSSVWKSYSLEFQTPFPEVDTLRVSAGFTNGNGKERYSEFWINEFELTEIAVPDDYRPPKVSQQPPINIKEENLVALGGRWYFHPERTSQELPKLFTSKNAHQLLYKTDKLIAPFQGNMSTWLKKGFLTSSGDVVSKDRFIETSFSIYVTKSHLVMKSQNIPNHPTAIFPDKNRYLDGNPHYIQQQNHIHKIPLVPQQNSKAVAMRGERNTNNALPMGSIGIATNGVIFFNPFDAEMGKTAVWRLDRCCGHPSPRNEYHYHKYPICVKSPWTDDGESHSPVIGFAFDGYPIYGPYEAKGVLARDEKNNPLNEFNIHYDADRGWHYHVTPGKFPHIIGGYWGEVERRSHAGLFQRPPNGPSGILGPPPPGRPRR